MQEKMLPWLCLFFYRVKVVGFGAVVFQVSKKFSCLVYLSRLDGRIDGKVDRQDNKLIVGLEPEPMWDSCPSCQGDASMPVNLKLCLCSVALLIGPV